MYGQYNLQTKYYTYRYPEDDKCDNDTFTQSINEK